MPPEAESLQAKHVVVAWKDTREARRAILDALPLLQAATDVTVVRGREPRRDQIRGAPRRGCGLTGSSVTESGWQEQMPSPRPMSRV